MEYHYKVVSSQCDPWPRCPSSASQPRARLYPIQCSPSIFLYFSGFLNIASAKVNSKQKLKLTFDHLFDEKMQEIVDEHFDFYKKVNDNKAIKTALVAKMFDMVYQELAKT